MSRCFVRSLFMASGLVLAASTTMLAGPAPRAGERRVLHRGPAWASTQPVAEIIDLAAPEAPLDSMQAIVARLGILGVDAETASRVALEAAEGEPAAGDGLAASLRLAPLETAKAAQLLRAWKTGEPVTLVGRMVPPDVASRTAELMARGIDPDVAAWTALRDSQDSTDVTEATVVRGDGMRELDPASLGGSEPVAQVAFCRTCPSFDFAMNEPGPAYATASGTLVAGADCKIYRFVARAGRTYRFTFCDGGGTAGFDTVLSASSAACVQLGSNDDSCGVLSRLDVASQGDGYLYVKVSDKNARGGAYTLAFADVTPPGSGSCAACPVFDFGSFTPTASWQSHSSTVDAGGCRVYRFYTYVNHSYRFTMCDGGGTATFDAALDSMRANCTSGPSNDDTCGVLPSLDIAVNATGYVYVKVRSSGGSGGAYTLAYKDTSSECLDCPAYNHGPFTPQVTYQTHGSSLVQGQGCKKYAFSLTGGRTYRFTLCQGGGSGTFDSVLRVLDGSCVTQASNDNTCGALSEVDYTPASSGLHYLEVATNATQGAYTLAYVELCRPCGDPHAVLAAPTAASYSLKADAIVADGCRMYGIDLVANRIYRFSFCGDTGGSASFDTQLQVRNPTCGGAVTNDNACALLSEIDYTATATGRHWVRVRGTGTASGSFTLAYGEIGRLCPEMRTSITPTTTPATSSQTIRRLGNYTFAASLTAGKRYVFSLCAADSGSAAFDSALTVRDPSCNVLGTNGNACGDDGRVSVLAASTGTHHVTVSEEAGAVGGAFTLAYRELTLCDPLAADATFAEPGNSSWQVAPADTVAQNGFKIYRFNIGPTASAKNMSFALCTGGGPNGSAAFPATLEVYRGDTCALMTSDTSSCSSQPRINNLVGIGAGSFTYVVKIVGDNPATDFGAFTLAYRKQP